MIVSGQITGRDQILTFLDAGGFATSEFFGFDFEAFSAIKVVFSLNLS